MLSADQVCRHGGRLRGEREEHLVGIPSAFESANGSASRVLSTGRKPPHPVSGRGRSEASQAGRQHVLGVVGEHEALAITGWRRHHRFERHRSQAVQEAAAGQGSGCGVGEAGDHASVGVVDLDRVGLDAPGLAGLGIDARRGKTVLLCPPGERVRDGRAVVDRPGQAEVGRALGAFGGEPQQFVQRAAGREGPVGVPDIEPHDEVGTRRDRRQLVLPHRDARQPLSTPEK